MNPLPGVPPGFDCFCFSFVIAFSKNKFLTNPTPLAAICPIATTPVAILAASVAFSAVNIESLSFSISPV